MRALGIPGSSGLIFFRHKFHDAKLDAAVKYARHVLSIDENREAFKPELWEGSEEDHLTGRLKQVWFPGVHSDVGGGYPGDESGLSDLAMRWMLDEAGSVEHPIIVDKSKLKLAPSYKAMQHDERSGSGWFWREGTREAFSPATFHRDDVELRFAEPEVAYSAKRSPYRPKALSNHPTFNRFY